MPSTGLPHAEVEMGLLGRAHAGRSHRTKAIVGRDPFPGTDGDRGQVEVGGVVAVAGPNAHGQAGGPRRAGEADQAARGGHHRIADGPGDVDATVLSGGVGIIAVAIRRDDLAVEGPTPVRPRGWSRQQEDEEQDWSDE